MNACGIGPHPACGGGSYFEFHDGTEFMDRMTKIVRACYRDPNSPVAQTEFFVPEGLDERMVPSVVELFRGKSLRHVLMGTDTVKLLLADRFKQPIGIGGDVALPRTPDGMQQKDDINFIFHDLLKRAQERYAELYDSKRHEIAETLAKLGFDINTITVDEFSRVLATGQTLYQAAQLQVVTSQISMVELRKEFEHRRAPNAKGHAIFMEKMHEKMATSDMFCLNEVSCEMLEYIHNNLPPNHGIVEAQRFEDLGTVLVYDNTKFELDRSPTAPPRDLFRKIMATTAELHKVATGKKSKAPSTKANDMLSFHVLKPSGIMARHLQGVKVDFVAAGKRVWVCPLHLPSNGDAIPLLGRTCDAIAQHLPPNVVEVMYLGDFNTVKKHHDQLADTTSSLNMAISPPLRHADGTHGPATTYKQRVITVMHGKAAKVVSKTCDSIMTTKGVHTEWEVFGQHTIASSRGQASSRGATMLPSRNWVSDHYGVDAMVEVDTQ